MDKSEESEEQKEGWKNERLDERKKGRKEMYLTDDM